MDDKGWMQDSITIKGEEIPLKVGFINHLDLKYYPENPRVYSIISSLEKEPTQEEIQELLLERDHVKQLIQSIKANGGLTDPVFVHGKTMVVIEGNSRLAAYRYLALKDPIRWGKIKCNVLPEDIDEDKIFSLLGEYHIIGKQDWIPYEQAGYLYRSCKKFNNSAEEISKSLGMSVKTINLLIKVYSFMLEHSDNHPNRWSYYYEYLRSNFIKRTRKEYPELDKLIIKKIKSEEIKQAREIRDDLPIIIKAGKKVMNSFLSCHRDFQECVERARSGGADNHLYATLHKFRDWLVSEKTEKEIDNLSGRLFKKVKFELKKIRSGIEHIEKHLSDD